MIEFNKRWIYKQFRKMLVEPTVCQNCSNMGFVSHLWYSGTLYWSCKECNYIHISNGRHWEVFENKETIEEIKVVSGK